MVWFQVIEAVIEKHKQNSQTFKAFSASFSQDWDPSLTPHSPVSAQGSWAGPPACFASLTWIGGWPQGASAHHSCPPFLQGLLQGRELPPSPVLLMPGTRGWQTGVHSPPTLHSPCVGTTSPPGSSQAQEGRVGLGEAAAHHVTWAL